MKKSALLASVTVLCSSLAIGGIAAEKSAAVTDEKDIQWNGYGGSKYFQRYSPLNQIDAKNVAQLKVVWERPGLEPAIQQRFPDLTPSTYQRGTPTMVGGVLYAPDAVGLVEAFDAVTGKTKWIQKPLPTILKEAAGNSTRGVGYWSSGGDARIFSIRGEFLYAMDANTGEPIKQFGDGGKVYVSWPTSDHCTYRTTTAPTVAGEVVVMGGAGGCSGDVGTNREAYPENIRGYDVRTGQLLWTFHVLPQEGEKGLETWGKESWRYSGTMGSWGGISVDEELGYVYVPTSAPAVSYYGGYRPGNNLYADSLLCLDARTGKLVWHFQLVHHDLWDYDTASPPILGDVKVGGKTVKAVMQANKPGYLYVFDRKTGEAIWPVEERPVPQSTVPGEATSPTQPVPTKLPPFDKQGIKESDLMDFTPALRAEAKKVADQYILGAMFAPGSLIDPAPGGKKGTLVVPGVWGSGNWNTGAFDPETGYYYAVSRTEANVYGLSKLSPPATLDYSILTPLDAKPESGNQQPTASPPAGTGGRRASLPSPPVLPSGLPLLKPPYGHITAYDIGKGELKWMAPNGDDAAIRENPALKGVKLPPLLGNAGRGAPLVTKTLLFLADASDSVLGRAGIKNNAKLRAYDKATGKVVAEFPIPSGATGAPMSYEMNGKQYIVLPIGGTTHAPSWLAFALK